MGVVVQLSTGCLLLYLLTRFIPQRTNAVLWNNMPRDLLVETQESLTNALSIRRRADVRSWLECVL